MSKKPKDAFHIQVLQNGVCIAQGQYNLRKSRSIRIGPKRSADLLIPHYESSFNIFKISPNKIEAYLPRGSSGFIKRKDGFQDIQAKDQASVPIQNSDFGKIETDDLQILFKIAPHALIVKSNIDRRIAMRDGLGSYTLQNSVELRSMLFGLVFGCIFLWSWLHFIGRIAPHERIQITELENEYKLPFIYERHISNLPEALRDKLDQNDWINQSMDYAKAFVATLMDWDAAKKSFFLTETRNYYAKIYAQQNDKIHQLVDERTIKDQSAKAVPGKSTLYVPAVAGESLEQLIQYTLSKINLAHNAHEKMLEQRQALTRTFKSEVVIDLKPPTTAPDFIKLEEGQGYRQALHGSAESLSDEEYMYEKGLLLAAQAKSRSAQSPYLTSVIGIDARENYLSFLGEASVSSLDQKLLDLKSRSIDTGAKPKAPEILYGYIDPKVVENTISKYSHELRLCYELALRRNNDAKGKMEWSFEINTKGGIGKIKLLTSDIEDTQMVRCIQRKMASWVFPRPDRGKIEVTYPFHFSKG